MKYLFLTHESIRTTPVAKAMLWDLADEFSKDSEVVVFSGDDSPIQHIKVDHTVFAADRNRSKIIRGLKFIWGWKQLGKYLFSDVLVYCRSYPVMLIFGVFFSIARKKVIFDTRGLFFHELFDSGHSNSRFLLRPLLFLETIMLFASDKVICVSEAQKEYYEKKCSGKNKIFVVHNGAPSKISKLADGRIEGVLSLLYLGSLVKWHSIDRVKGICDSLSKEANIRISVLTRSVEQAQSIFKGAPYQVDIFEHDFRDKPIQFDYGFCLISGGISKTVCCPVKFAEYLAAKTKVIASNNVQLHKDYVDQQNGILVDLEATDDQIARSILARLSVKGQDFEKPPTFSFDHQIASIQAIVASL